jgi:branched-chain amino acid aminotransferase
MNPFCFINNAYLPLQEAALHIKDLSILRAYGIFDFFRTQNGRPLFADEHIKRFIKSAGYLNLEPPMSQVEIKKTVDLLLDKNKDLWSESTFRLLLTGGISEDGYTPTEPHFIIINEEYRHAPDKQFSEGVKLITHEFLRELPHIKTINYITPISLLPQIKGVGAIDVLYHKFGMITEVSRSNFFLVKQGKIYTPSENILKGITRSKVIDLARIDHQVIEGDLLIDDLYFAEEAFMTGTTKRITPVVLVDGLLIGNGKPGKITRRLMDLFEELERKN